MNQVLIDNSLLVVSFLSALVLVKFSKRRKSGPLFSFFLLFPPVLIFLNMWAHTVAVLLVNYKRYLAGSFQYNFSFYSLLLLGVVFIVVSGFAIHCSRKRVEGDRSKQSTILWLNLVIILSFTPIIFINPIGALPVIAALVSSITLLIGRSKKPKVAFIKNNEQHSVNAKVDLSV